MVQRCKCGVTACKGANVETAKPVLVVERMGRRRAAEGRGVATPRPPNKEDTMNRAPTSIQPSRCFDMRRRMGDE